MIKENEQIKEMEIDRVILRVYQKGPSNRTNPKSLV